MSVSLANTLRALCTGMLSLGLSATPARAHPLHTSFTTVRIEPGVLQLRVRVFADDFSAAVARFAHRAPPADFAVDVSVAYEYINERVQIFDGTQRMLLRPCGVSRDEMAYFICLEGTPRQVGALLVRNQLLCDVHSDQVNVAKVTSRSTSRTVLFTRDRPEQTIRS